MPDVPALAKLLQHWHTLPRKVQLLIEAIVDERMEQYDTLSDNPAIISGDTLFNIPTGHKNHTGALGNI